ncbi:hypothetical protein SteCoe_13240 [Stentor coeruleus]|uniref:Protein kinase domain-containing protein n=1 Tax=Stentor coeruleus TaxID=5963 RepID=A0A1R2C8R5_9CILI|nr:hypothetical protein SteCoe_13240 [Stentor coeruleus]
MDGNDRFGEREMKIMFYKIIEAYYILRKKNIVHHDVTSYNILVESPEKVKIIDFEHSSVFEKKIKGMLQKVLPTKWVTPLFLSPELKTWTLLANTLSSLFIKYNPFKSDVFSIGLSLLDACGIDIKGLNEFGKFYHIHIKELLTINYNYIVNDSLRRISYRILRDELQNTINKKIEDFPYDFLKQTLRKMLEVDFIKRASIKSIFKHAKHFMQILD